MKHGKKYKYNPGARGIMVLAGVGHGKVSVWEEIDGRNWNGDVAAEMYAGPTKPKPFQRKRANLSFQKQGKLPPLPTMRDIAIARHQGSGAPVPTSLSKRVALAFEHVYKGTNSFVVVQYHEVAAAGCTRARAGSARARL